MADACGSMPVAYGRVPLVPSGSTITFEVMHYVSTNQKLNFERASPRWTVSARETLGHHGGGGGWAIGDLVRQMSGAELVQEGPHCRRARIVDQPNLFSEWEILVTITESEDEHPASIEASIAFESNEARIFVFIWLIMSIVGIPLAYAWRALSIQRCQTFARRALARSEFTESAIPRVFRGPYR